MIISFQKSKRYRETWEPGKVLLPSDPALHLCSLKAAQKREERGEGEREREGRERKEGRSGERRGLENILEEGARHQEAKVMVLRLVFRVKNCLWGNCSRRISEKENYLRAPTPNDSSTPSLT